MSYFPPDFALLSALSKMYLPLADEAMKWARYKHFETHRINAEFVTTFHGLRRKYHLPEPPPGVQIMGVEV